MGSGCAWSRSSESARAIWPKRCASRPEGNGGHRDAERRYAREVLPGLLARDRWDLALAFHVEAAASAMNQGDYRDAVVRIERVADSARAFGRSAEGLPAFWAWRASVVRGIACQALGRFDVAGEEPARQEALSGEFDVPDLR